jgi:peroxiredoxin
MSSRQTVLMLALLPLAAGAAYKHRAMFSSHEVEAVDCADCAAFDGDDEQPAAEHGGGSRPSGAAAAKAQPAVPDDFKRVQRPGSVDVEKEYNLSGLTIPKEQVHTLLPRDAIPALTDPKTQKAEDAAWLPDDARVIKVVVGNDVLGVPLRVLDWHEVVNTTVGGEPIAATYCPLCDSATVFSRRVTPKAGDEAGSGVRPSPVVLEFGVSGALYNSNVLMYDRKDKGLWSQLGMHAVSGPLAGTSLDMLPVEVVSFAAFKKAHPGAKIVSNETGHERDYSRSPYETYFKDEKLMVPVAGVGEALPRKTLGVGIAVGEGDAAKAWFVPVDAIPQDGHELTIPVGKIMIVKSDAGVAVTKAPQGVRTAQTFYYSWSAFYPKTTVVMPGAGDGVAGSKTNSAPSPQPGLAVGTTAPDVTVTSVDGNPVQLASLYKDGPVVLTFYRGGWCPICTRTLAAWGPRLAELKAAGGTFVALTPEKPDLAVKTRDAAHADYQVYSDGDFAAAKAFRVHFVVDADTKAKYEKFGLKVAQSNVSGTWELPAPATFVIDKTGIIRWSFAEWDYKKRADPDEVIRAVQALK